MPFLIRLVDGLIEVLVVLILIDVVASWIPPLDRHSLIRELRRLTDPVLAPFRAIVPPERLGIDVSPILAIVALEILSRLIG
jgi:YggT family protein